VTTAYPPPKKPATPLSAQGPGLQPAPGTPLDVSWSDDFGQGGPTEIPAPQPPGLQPAPSSPDPFAAMGGGVQVNGGWVPKNHPLAQQAGAPPTTPGAPTPGAPTAGGAPTNLAGVLGGTAAPGGQSPQGQPTNLAGAFQQALINRLSPQDISAQNPAIKGTIAANRNAESRGLQRTQGALAERAASTGQAGGLETGLRQAMGESAGRQGAFEGNALFGLHQQQQNDLTNALGLGGQLLSDQQRQDLQRYGLDLDATLRREGLSQSGQLGNRELDIRNTLGLGQLDLGRQGLAQNESQFGRQLGANLGLGQAQLNQSALLALLNGL
jgi:hypothetical protein